MKKEGSDLKIMEEMERKKLQDRYIRFDWAIKRLLRQKANFDVLDGFLTVMLNESRSSKSSKAKATRKAPTTSSTASTSKP